MIRIAHVSDLHVLDLDGVSPWRYVNKRATGLVNLRWRRKHVHKREALERVLQGIGEQPIDHLVITGDMTNLALESEFAAVATMLRDAVALPPERITVIPGNHDAYTAGSSRRARFAEYLGTYTHTDRPDLAAKLPMGQYPLVRLLGDDLVLLGLSSALPQLPLLAAGAIGPAQLAAVAQAVRDPALRARHWVVMAHHPLHVPPTAWKRFSQGLSDANRLLDVLTPLRRVTFLHGHLHQRMDRSWQHGELEVRSCGATSASLLEADRDRRAGFNVYAFDQGALHTSAQVLGETLEAPLQTQPLPVLGADVWKR